MIAHLFGIVWACAQYFWYLLPFILLACGALIRRLLWQRHTAILLGGTGKKSQLSHFSMPTKILKTLLLTVALVSLALALSRPQWDDTQQTVAQEGRDVLIMLDISRSMLAQDIKPSRLEAAKHKIKELVEQLTAERVGLIVFSGTAFVLCPFTRDTAAFLGFLQAIDAESISSGATALDKAFETAIETFSAMPTKKHKIVIIVTDGGDFSSSLQSIEAKIKEMGLTVFTLGIGTPEGAPIPLFDEQGRPQGHIKDAQGAIVITRLNEPLLKQLSAATGARYIRVAADDSDTHRLVVDVKRFEKEKFEDRLFSAKQEKYGIFAAISFICLLIEWLL